MDRPDAPLIVTNLSLSENTQLVSLADVREPAQGSNPSCGTVFY